MLTFGLIVAFSYHTVERPIDSWNAFHPGFEITAPVNDHFHLIAGGYVNSEDTFSAFAGTRVKPFLSGALEPLSLDIGIATGYIAADVVPMARVSWSLNEQDSLKLFAIPVVTLINNKKVDEVGVAIGIEFVPFKTSF